MAIFARNPLRITVVLLLFALYNLGESVEKSKFGCIVCKKKSQLRPFQKAKAYTNDFRILFLVFEPRLMMPNLSFAKHAEELSKSTCTDGLESRSIMLVPSPVMCEHFVFPYLHTLLYDMASPSRAVMLAALILMRNKI